MWFLFGFITLAAACISSLIWRRTVSWRGSAETAYGTDYEYGVRTYRRSVQCIKVGVACGQGFSFTLKPERTLDR